MKKIIFIILLLVMGIYNCYALECNNNISLGTNDENVKQIQQLLNIREKCNLETDGIFGPKTEECVKKYQQKNNLVVDGIVGPITCNYLIGNPAVKEYKDYGYRYGIVTADEVNIRKNPSTKAAILKVTDKYQVYQISRREGNWYKIKYTREKEGYISKDYFINDFILVDINYQKLYFYKFGKLFWSTSVVTGMKNLHDTPIGVYKLSKNNFSYKTVLSGYNDDGSTYNAPVDYWMPFILSSGIGFHDATWRSYSEFNKTEYLNNGSHGCVNMHHEAAEKLYNENFTAIDVIVRD